MPTLQTPPIHSSNLFNLINLPSASFESSLSLSSFPSFIPSISPSFFLSIFQANFLSFFSSVFKSFILLSILSITSLMSSSLCAVWLVGWLDFYHFLMISKIMRQKQKQKQHQQQKQHKQQNQKQQKPQLQQQLM